MKVASPLNVPSEPVAAPLIVIEYVPASELLVVAIVVLLLPVLSVAQEGSAFETLSNWLYASV